jgi:hypothetical protein
MKPAEQKRLMDEQAEGLLHCQTVAAVRHLDAIDAIARGDMKDARYWQHSAAYWHESGREWRCLLDGETYEPRMNLSEYEP